VFIILVRNVVLRFAIGGLVSLGSGLFTGLPRKLQSVQIGLLLFAPSCARSSDTTALYPNV
jgi:hypothetical protein